MIDTAVSLHLPTNVHLAEIERPERRLLIRRIERNAAPVSAIHRGGRGDPPTHGGWARGTRSLEWDSNPLFRRERARLRRTLIVPAALALTFGLRELPCIARA
jgi:hypothetical protein